MSRPEIRGRLSVTYGVWVRSGPQYVTCPCTEWCDWKCPCLACHSTSVCFQGHVIGDWESDTSRVIKSRECTRCRAVETVCFHGLPVDRCNRPVCLTAAVMSS